MKTISKNIVIEVKNNVFEDGYADWGGYFCLEQIIFAKVENNIFLNGIVKSYFGNGFGTGGVLALSGNVDLSYTIFIGQYNFYCNTWTENKGGFINIKKI